IAGLAAALPLLESNSLQEVFRGGHAAPPDLSAKVLSSLSRIARSSMRKAALKPAGSALKSWLAMGVITTLVATGSSALFYFGGTRTPAPVPSAPSPVPSTPSPVPSTPSPVPSAQTPLVRRWSCANGALTDFEVLKGTWTWNAGDKKNPPAMISP